MITIETPLKTVNMEIDSLRSLISSGIGGDYAEGARQALEWLVYGDRNPSDMLKRRVAESGV